MRVARSNLRAGILTLAAIGAFCLALWGWLEWRASGRIPYRAWFTKEQGVYGLAPGAPVRVGGIKRGNVTAIVDQLEKEQLVQRRPQPADRRAYAVHLTPAGREVFAAMATAHESWVIELLSPLSAQQQEQLHQLLGHLKNGKPSPKTPQHHAA